MLLDGVAIQRKSRKYSVIMSRVHLRIRIIPDRKQEQMFGQNQKFRQLESIVSILTLIWEELS